MTRVAVRSSPEADYFEPPNSWVYNAPYRLMRAVLARAIYDILPASCSELTPQEAVRGARYWIFDEQRTGPWSFTWVCEHLDYDPDSLRRALKGFCGIQPRGETHPAALVHEPRRRRKDRAKS